MEKTSLGLKVNLVAALCFICALFGGYVVALVLVGFILIKEENTWLKKMTLKAFLVMVAFSVLGVAITFLPDVIDFVYDVIDVFTDNINKNFYYVVLDIQTVFSDILYLLKIAVYAVLVVLAAMGKTLRLPVVDAICDKFIKEKE